MLGLVEAYFISRVFAIGMLMLNGVYINRETLSERFPQMFIELFSGKPELMPWRRDTSDLLALQARIDLCKDKVDELNYFSPHPPSLSDNLQTVAGCTAQSVKLKMAYHLLVVSKSLLIMLHDFVDGLRNNKADQMMMLFGLISFTMVLSVTLVIRWWLNSVIETTIATSSNDSLSNVTRMDHMSNVKNVSGIKKGGYVKRVTDFFDVKRLTDVMKAIDLQRATDINKTTSVNEVANVAKVDDVKKVIDFMEVDIKQVTDLKRVTEVKKVTDVKQVTEVKNVMEVMDVKEINDVKEVTNAREIRGVVSDVKCVCVHATYLPTACIHPSRTRSFVLEPEKPPAGRFLEPEEPASIPIRDRRDRPRKSDLIERRQLERLSSQESKSLRENYTVVLNGREIIQEALQKRSVDFAGREIGLTGIQCNPAVRGILSKQYGHSFKKNKAVTLSILKEFGFGRDAMEQRIMRETDELFNHIKSENGNSFNPDDMFTLCALNVIASIVFGQRLSQKDGTLTDLAHSLHSIMTSKRRYVDYCPILQHVPRYKKLIEEAKQLTRDQLKFIADGTDRSVTCNDLSFVKRIKEKLGTEYDEEELHFIVRDLLIAGSETIATTLQWAMILMANHQSIQKRLRDEIELVVPATRYPALGDASKLPYVEAAILELTRVKTTVPLALLHTTLTDTEVGGYFLPKGATVIPNLRSAHMDPNVFPQPEVYNPERFLDSSGKLTGRDRLIAFSLGKRSCLGEQLARQELFLFFTSLIQKFDIRPPEGQEKIESDEIFCVSTYPTPFKIRLIPRD